MLQAVGCKQPTLRLAYAQLRVRGVSRANIIKGAHFPVNYGYVSFAQMGQEARGLLLGPINVGGSVYNVWYSKQ